MGKLINNLNNAKARLDFCEYELSEEVKAKKFALCKELFYLLHNNTYNNSINIEDANMYVENDHYDKHLDYYNPNCKFYLTNIFVYDTDDAFVEDEDGNEYSFIDDLTLNEVEKIVAEVKYLIDDED